MKVAERQLYELELEQHGVEHGLETEIEFAAERKQETADGIDFD